MTQLKIKLPGSFFEEEIRNGYTVSREMKKVWAVELDLLAEFLRVCGKYHLKCWADAGTLLGAVRHKGFIPWDDDIDLVMFREDYDKMVAIAGKEFKEPYFFQNAYSEQDYYRGHAQFRNSNTTGILSSERNMRCKHNLGIFIDIFVLDGVTDNRFLLSRQRLKINFIKKLIYHYVYDRGTRKDKICHKIVETGWKGDYRKLFRETEKCMRKYSVERCEQVAPLNFIFETEKRIRDKHLYDETIWLDFENTKIPAPAGYQEYLSGRYGDYWKPAQIPTTHGEIFFDADRPFIFYEKKGANE